MTRRSVARRLAPWLLLALPACSSRRPARAPAPDAAVATVVETPAAEVTAPPAPAAAPAEPARTAPAAPTAAAGLVPAEQLGSAVVERRRGLVARGQQLAPEEVGYYMDVQEARFRQLAPEAIRVSRNGEQLVLTLPGRLAFEVGRAELSPRADSALSTVARVLADYRLTLVSVRSHTDASGDADGNRRLSEQRALAVVRALRTHGVPADRIVAAGIGAEQPVASNSSAEGRDANRRIELVVAPLRP